MRAFVTTAIVLLILAAVAFGFGWVQILIPPGAYAVVATKTGGFESEVIPSGVFAWRWERLIPTNLTLYRFLLRPHRAELSFGGELPSAQLYSSILPQNPDFTYHGQATVELELRPASLPALVQEGRLTPDTLEAFYEASGRELAQALAAKLAETAPGAGPEPLGAAFDARLLEELAPRFPHLQLRSLSVTALQAPDRALYELARRSYTELVAARDQARNAAAAQQGVDLVAEDARRGREAATLGSLREYGKLLNEYPVLLKAMYAQALAGKDLSSIPGLDLESFLSPGR